MTNGSGQGPGPLVFNQNSQTRSLFPEPTGTQATDPVSTWIPHLTGVASDNREHHDEITFFRPTSSRDRWRSPGLAG